MTEIPNAKNGLGALDTHYQRRRYIRKAYPLLDRRYAIDLWYGDKSLYGRIDQQRIPQMISETNLKNFPSAPEVLAADFVVDAFEDFRQYLINASRRQKVDLAGSFLGNIAPKKGWVSAREEYDANIKIIYSAFVREFLEINNRHGKIRDFGGFMKQMKRYAHLSSTVTPMTLSGLVTSRSLPCLVSGLVVEISDINHDDDRAKFERFMEDPAFEIYQRAARKFGFRIDYNAPWRLVADIASAEMLKYMNEYEINSVRELFELYYYNTHRLDVALVKDYLIQLYNDYAVGNPIAKRVSSGSLRDAKVETELIRRVPTPAEEIDADFNNFYWLEFYFDVRSKELQIQWDPKARQKKLQETKDLLDLVDFPKALEYIVAEMNKQARR